MEARQRTSGNYGCNVTVSGLLSKCQKSLHLVNFKFIFAKPRYAKNFDKAGNATTGRNVDVSSGRASWE